MKTLLSTLAAAAMLATATPALAERAETATVTVRHDDLRLDTPRGQRALEHRLDMAAREVCGIHEQVTGTRIRSNDANACYRQARAGAMRQYAALLDDTRLGG